MSSMKYTPTKELLAAVIITALACVWALSLDATDLIASVVGWLLLASLLVLVLQSLRIRWYMRDFVRSRQPESERKPTEKRIVRIQRPQEAPNLTARQAESNSSERIWVERMLYEGCPNANANWKPTSGTGHRRHRAHLDDRTSEPSRSIHSQRRQFNPMPDRST